MLDFAWVLRRALAGADSEAVPPLAQQHSRETWAEALRGLDLAPALRRAIAIELALRDKALAPDHAIFVDLQDGPAPLRLLPIEHGLPAGVTRFGGIPGSTILTSPRVHVVSASEPLTLSSSREITTDEMRLAIEPCVAGWVARSNGTIEARVFSIETARGHHPDAELLSSLGLLAIPAGETATVHAIDASGALAMLFTCAHGGAYSRLVADAPARDLAWTSLRGLLGVSVTASSESVAALALASTFVSFSGTSFFSDVAWDLGIAVVTPARDRLSILAATDTD